MAKLLTHPLAKGLLTPLIAGTVLAILAPFGTDGFSITSRFIYWIGLTLAGGLGAMVTRGSLRKFRPDAAIGLRTLVQSFGATAAVAPFVLGLFGHDNLSAALLTLFYIWVIAIVITSIGELASRSPEPVLKETARPALLDRLPPKFREAELYAISSEDHYIRIHSAAGEHMLLMRLTDAEDLIAPTPGLKPHRSWWVAEGGVESVTRASGKLRIVLRSGTDVPVSREGAKRVREAGWI